MELDFQYDYFVVDKNDNSLLVEKKGNYLTINRFMPCFRWINIYSGTKDVQKVQQCHNLYHRFWKFVKTVKNIIMIICFNHYIKHDLIKLKLRKLSDEMFLSHIICPLNLSGIINCAFHFRVSF